MLDLTQLRSFLEVAERGSVAAAASALGYTPPAVSQHVSKLERSLDASLFDRLSGQLRLTPAGEALVPVARELTELATQAVAVVHAPAPQPHVTLAGFASAIAALVTPNLETLSKHASIVIIEAEDAAALRELRLGHVDVAITQEYPGDQTQRDPRLDYVALASDQLRLVLPPTLPASIKVADLAAMGAGPRWLINGTGTRCEAATREILRTAAIEAEISGDVTDNHTLLQLVAVGHGATIVPDLVLASAGSTVTNTVTVATEPLGMFRTLLAVTRRRPSPAVTAMVGTMASMPD